jgi:hypothetical protein
MRADDFTTMLQQVSQAAPDDYASMLADLALDRVEGDEDFLSRVMSVYQQAMDVYGPAQITYESAVLIMEHTETGGLAASANR